MLCKEHIVGLHTNPIPFSCLGLILVAIGPFGFSIFTSPTFGYTSIFGNLDFIQILITKYTIGSLNATE